MERHSQGRGLACILIALSFVQIGCSAVVSLSGTHEDNQACTAPSPSSSASPDVQVQHVFIVLEENKPYNRIIRDNNMPYLKSLATAYSYARGYYANTHPSIGNYFMLTTGQIISNDDGFSSPVTADNIVRHLIAAGKTWKEYSENLPFVGYTGGDAGTDAKPYTAHHNPLSYFSDVRGSSAQSMNLVPFTQFAADLANHALPNYSFIVPSNLDDAHSCPVAIPNCTVEQKMAAADNWLATNIDPLIKSSDFNTPGDGLLIITFDESDFLDTVMGGGHVAWVVVGPDVKKGFTSTTCYQHENTLRFMSEAIGLTDFPGAAAMAADMEELISGDTGR